MTIRTALHEIDTTGANDGDVPTVDAAGDLAFAAIPLQIVLLEVGQTVAQYESAHSTTVPTGTIIFQKG